MVSDPHLVVGGESRFDLAQGELGECDTALVSVAGLLLAFGCESMDSAG